MAFQTDAVCLGVYDPRRLPKKGRSTSTDVAILGCAEHSHNHSYTCVCELAYFTFAGDLPTLDMSLLMYFILGTATGARPASGLIIKQ